MEVFTMTESGTYFYTYSAIFEANVSGSARLVYAYLCKCADREGKSYPSHKTIGSVCGIGVTTVKKALSEIEGAGFITIRGQARPDRGRRANIYTIVKEAVKGFFLTYANIFIEKMTAKARLVYLYFCRLASGRGQAYPSHKTTAKACGLSVAGVRAAIDELEETGLIARQAQYRDNGGQRANLYTIIAEPDDVSGGSDPAQKKPDNAAAETVNDMYANDETQGAAVDMPPDSTDSADYSPSNSVSLISGKSGNTDSVMPNPCEIRRGFRRPGLLMLLFVLFFSMFSRVKSPAFVTAGQTVILQHPG
jgi:DNA-binding transcriptional regulator YhcF (GntR family)